MAEPETEKKTSPLFTDWSQLPEELLEIISCNVEDCFDLVHARSVCTSWRSTIPFPSCLSRQRYSLPTFHEPSLETNEVRSCTIEKIPLFLFRVRPLAAESASEYFFGGIRRDESEELPLPRPIQCSVKLEIQGSDPTLMNMHDCQIIPVGHRYRMFGWNPKGYRRVAFLPLYKEGRGGEFVVLLSHSYGKLMVLTSVEMRWKRLENVVPKSGCTSFVTFRGKFYLCFMNRETFVIDPHSLEVTTLMPTPERKFNFLVPCGDDELFLVVVMVPDFGVNRSTCKVNRLDEEGGKWVEVSDLGDRVLFIAQLGNVCCSAKELPNGCGVSGNSIVFTYWPRNVTFFYKYGLYRENEEENIVTTVWRTSREKRVVILNTSPAVALRVEH